MKKVSRGRPVRGRPAAKQLRAIQTSRHWRVSHYRHTGRVLPGRNTSYPLLAMLLLCTGILLAGWTHLVTADSGSGQYSVSLSVPGPAPIAPALITNLTPDEHFTATPISISGTCPTDTYVSVSRNGLFSGVALCQSDNSWTLTTDLFSGENAIQATDYNFTDVPGPASPVIDVWYDPPTNVVPSGPVTTSPTETLTPSPEPTKNTDQSGSDSGSSNMSTSSGAVTAEPLVLKARFNYRGVYTNESLTYQLDVEGGTAPYALDIDWGDGDHQLISREAAGPFSLSHTYHRAGGYKGSYVVKLSATDDNGQSTVLQLLAIVNNPGGSAAAASTSGGGTSLSTGVSSIHRFLVYIWPSYGLVILVLTSFWLGERREFHILNRRYAKRKHA